MRFLTPEEKAERERRRAALREAVARQEEANQAAAAAGDTDVEIANTLLRPPQAKTFEEAGVSSRVLEGLILRTIKQRGAMTFQMVADALRVNLGVVEDMLRELRDRKLIADLKPLYFNLTHEGRTICYDLEREDAYVGPCPVSFEAYCQMVIEQSKRSHRVTVDEVLEAFTGYALRTELLLTLKEGYNSQKSLFFYGPPGNGKTLVTGGLHRLMDREPVVLPYAFEFNGRVVRYYDPAYHEIWEEKMEEEIRDATPPETPDRYRRVIYLQPDERWLICHAPLVVVGTEFRVEHFEIAYDGVYDAPPQVKANNGVFIFDDLGRQQQDHNMILNQFIYPLESQESIVKFGGGSSMRVPYKQRLFLSTNLNKDDIIDDAFKRRLLYQVLVDRPTVPLWRKIFMLEAKKAGCTDEAKVEQWCDLLLTWWERDGRVLRACDPRNIFVMLDATLLPGETLEDTVTETTLERIYWQFPAGFARDQVAYTDEANWGRIRKLAEWEEEGVAVPPDWDDAFHHDPAPAWDGNPPDTRSARSDDALARAKPGAHSH